jgi:hypothetical protein
MEQMVITGGVPTMCCVCKVAELQNLSETFILAKTFRFLIF